MNYYIQETTINNNKDFIMKDNSVFKTDKRIRLGIWGLGRGQRLADDCKMLNIDIVAGCDINPHMRQEFGKIFPEAFVTDNAEKFLAYDMDAVLIATYFKDHAKHTIQALNADKHVLCEVTAFFTPAEGVQVIEAVEKSGKIYNFLENYPFTKENSYLKKLYRDGFFGEMQYAEASYLHECRTLGYAYNVSGGVPVEPGYTVHNWRASLNGHYYITHSLGPVMDITGLRPVAISALPSSIQLPGYMSDCRGIPLPSMIKMSNGSIMRNMMGATTNDNHFEMRLYGTKAGAEKIRDFKIRVGACGGGELLNIKPEWDEFADIAEKSGHNGGDFFELYYFAREFFTGEKAPIDVYSAADMTLAGIMAVKSFENDGIMVDIPDFRKKEDRDKYRNDHFKFNEKFDTENIFPEGHDKNITANLTTVMTNLYPLNLKSGIPAFNMAVDGMKLYDNIIDAQGKLNIISRVVNLIKCLPELADDCRAAQKIIDAYPDSLPGKMLKKVLDDIDLEKIYNIEQFVAELEAWIAAR